MNGISKYREVNASVRLKYRRVESLGVGDDWEDVESEVKMRKRR